LNVCLSAGSAGYGFGQREEGYGDETLDYSTEGTRASLDTSNLTQYRANQKIVVHPMRTSNTIMLLMPFETEHPFLFSSLFGF